MRKTALVAAAAFFVATPQFALAESAPHGVTFNLATERAASVERVTYNGYHGYYPSYRYHDDDDDYYPRRYYYRRDYRDYDDDEYYYPRRYYYRHHYRHYYPYHPRRYWYY